MQRQSSYKVYMNTISNGELSEPLCDSVNRGLTLVRFLFCLCRNVADHYPLCRETEWVYVDLI